MAKRTMKSNKGRLIAKARYKEISGLLKGEAIGQYLKNRSEKAFIPDQDARRNYEQ